MDFNQAPTPNYPSSFRRRISHDTQPLRPPVIGDVKAGELGVPRGSRRKPGDPFNEATHKQEKEAHFKEKEKICPECEKPWSDKNTMKEGKARTVGQRHCPACVHPSKPCGACGGNGKQARAGRGECTTCQGTGKKTNVGKVCQKCNNARKVLKTVQPPPIPCPNWMRHGGPGESTTR